MEKIYLPIFVNLARDRASEKIASSAFLLKKSIIPTEHKQEFIAQEGQFIFINFNYSLLAIKYTNYK